MAAIPLSAKADSPLAARLWIDVDQDTEAREYVRQVNQNRLIIPTILFPDGSILVEPSNAELTRKLGLRN